MDDTHISSICLYLYNLTIVLSFLGVIYCTSATFDVAMFCAMHVGDAQCKTREPSSATNNSHAWPQTGPSVVKLWSPEQQSKEDDDDDDDDKTSMCIITGMLFIGTKI